MKEEVLRKALEDEGERCNGVHGGGPKVEGLDSPETRS